jgi:serine/threonine protein kinase
MCQQQAMATNLTRIGRYDVIQPIGQGGMGAVYLARDPMLDRQVAIKILRDEFESDELRARFLVEARAVARLQHRYGTSSPSSRSANTKAGRSS